MSLLFLIIISLFILLILYFLNIVKNAVVIGISAFVILLSLRYILHLPLSPFSIGAVIIFSILIYLLFEALNLIVNIYEVIKELISILFLPFKLLWKVIKNIFKSEKDNENNG